MRDKLLLHKRNIRNKSNRSLIDIRPKWSRIIMQRFRCISSRHVRLLYLSFGMFHLHISIETYLWLFQWTSLRCHLWPQSYPYFFILSIRRVVIHSRCVFVCTGYPPTTWLCVFRMRHASLCYNQVDSTRSWLFWLGIESLFWIDGFWVLTDLSA